ncbi:MAG: biopolymer transporter ExbD [Pirellulales bacterium]
MRRKKRRRSFEGVELNLAAMLDMAFQLLMFFILTFNPTPAESQLAMLLPPAYPVTRLVQPRAVAPDGSGAVAVPKSDIVVTALADAEGSVRDLAVDDQIVPDFDRLRLAFRRAVADRTAEACEVVVQIDEKLSYQNLMRVLDICTEEPSQSKTARQKIRFVELRRDPRIQQR